MLYYVMHTDTSDAIQQPSVIHSQDVNVEAFIFQIPEMNIEGDREGEESTLTILELQHSAIS